MRSRLTISSQHHQAINARRVFLSRSIIWCLVDLIKKNRSIIHWVESSTILSRWSKIIMMITESIISSVFKSIWTLFILILERTTFFRWFENFSKRLRSDTSRSFDLYEWTTNKRWEFNTRISWKCEESARSDSSRIRQLKTIKSNDLKEYWWSRLKRCEFFFICRLICDSKWSKRWVIWIIEFRKRS